VHNNPQEEEHVEGVLFKCSDGMMKEKGKKGPSISKTQLCFEEETHKGFQKFIVHASAG
jgi:hypothetical protein